MKKLAIAIVALTLFASAGCYKVPVSTDIVIEGLTLPLSEIQGRCFNSRDHTFSHKYGCDSCRSVTWTGRKLWFDLMCNACFHAERPLKERMVYLGEHSHITKEDSK